MLRTLSQRARAAVIVTATALAVVPVIGTMAAPGNGGVGSPAEECAEYGFPDSIGVKYEVDGSSWEGDVVAVGATVALAPGGITSAWTSTVAATGVLVKSSTSTLAWPGGTSGTGIYGHLAHQISHITFCYPGGGGGTTTTSTTVAPTTSTTVLPPLVPLTIDLDAAGSYTKTFEWDIDKSADVAWIARSGGSAPITYTVTTTQTGYDLSDQELDGTVTVTNPNPGAVTITSLAVTGADCQVQAPAVVASGDTELDVTCDISGVETEGALPTSLGASVGWADPSPLATVFGAGTTATPSYDVTNVNETITVEDAFDGGAAETIAPGSYTRRATTPATEGCRTVGNTATIVETGQSASASVTVCRQALTKGGFTIGFWHNKNGQAKITSSLCSTFAAYGNAWAGSGFPTTCTTSSLQAWVLSVFKSANSKDATLMLRAQMMATLLNVATDAGNHLGETDVPLDTALVGQTGPCLTVGELLTATNATWSTLVANRTGALTIKSIYDRINNNVQQVCP